MLARSFARLGDDIISRDLGCGGGQDRQQRTYLRVVYLACDMTLRFSVDTYTCEHSLLGYARAMAATTMFGNLVSSGGHISTSAQVLSTSLRHQ